MDCFDADWSDCFVVTRLFICVVVFVDCVLLLCYDVCRFCLLVFVLVLVFVDGSLVV